MNISAIHFINLWETPNASPFSGAENHLWVLLPALRAAGARVELGILLEASGPHVEARVTEMEAHGVRVHRFPFRKSPWCFPYHRFLDPLCLRELTRFLWERRDWIVHTHLDKADVHGKLAAQRAGCPFVVSTVHNNEPHHLRLKWFWLYRWMDRLTRHHIAISDAVRQHLVERERVAPGKVTVVRYGLHLPTRIVERAALRARLGLPQDRCIVGYVGRLVPQKNLEVLIAAMGRRPDLVCAIVGAGPLRGKLERQAAPLSNVRFLGHQPKAEDLLTAFDVLCLPSRWEGLGLVLLEAMLREVPVVGSRAGAIPEILGEGQYGWLFDPDDVDGLVAAIEDARQSGRVRAERTAEYVRGTFTVERMVEQTLRVYREAMKEGVS